MDRFLSRLRSNIYSEDISRSQARLIAAVLAVVAFIIMVDIFNYASHWYSSQQLNIKRTQIANEVIPQSNSLMSAINRRFALLEGIRAYTITSLTETSDIDAEFDIVAGNLYAVADGIRNFTIAPDGVNRWVYPIVGNENVYGHDLINDARPNVRLDVKKTIESGEIVISGPYELRQGGLGLVARLAIYDENDKFWGLVGMVVDMQPILDEASLNETSNLEWAIRSNESVFAGDPGLFDQDAVIVEISISQESWAVAARPIEGWNQSIGEPVAVFRTAGLVIILLLSGVVYLITNRQARLEIIVGRRTDELMRSNNLLQNEIEERSRTEDVLRQQSDILARGELIANMGSWKWNLLEDEIHWSHGLYRIFGLDIPDGDQIQISEEYLKFTHPDDRERVKTMAKMALELKRFIPIEHRILRDDGTVRVLFSDGEMLLNPDGVPAWLIGITQDVTERRAAEQLLQRQATWSRYISDAVIEIDANWVITDWNDAAVAIYGWEDDEAVGLQIDSLLCTEYQEVTLDEVQTHLDEHSLWTGTVKQQSNCGDEKILDSAITFIRDESGKIVCGIIINRDITQRKLAEERQFQLKLEKERVEILTKFFNQAAHEFKTPLSVINLNAYNLTQLMKTEQQVEFINRIEQQVESLARLLDSLTIMTHLDHGYSLHKENFNFIGLLNLIEFELRDSFEQKDITLVVNSDSDQVMFCGDQKLLKRAIRNLLENACEHSSSGTMINIEVEQTSKLIVVEISDEGTGMPEDVLPHIFDRFYRFDLAWTRRGFGLGLPITKSIVEYHHGSIDVRSTPDGGSTFTVRLPR